MTLKPRSKFMIWKEEPLRLGYILFKITFFFLLVMNTDPLDASKNRQNTCIKCLLDVFRHELSQLSGANAGYTLLIGISGRLNWKDCEKLRNQKWIHCRWRSATSIHMQKMNKRFTKLLHSRVLKM